VQYTEPLTVVVENRFPLVTSLSNALVTTRDPDLPVS